MHCKMFSNIRGLYSLDDGIITIDIDIATCPVGLKSSLVKIHWSNTIP